MSDVAPAVRRHAVLVDAGYLYAAVGQLVLGSPTRRDFRIATEPLIAALLARAGGSTPGELLRMYWYDAARDRVPTVEQRQIAALPHVKVRLGNLNSAGQQKGVDAQLRQDLEVLARHRAVSDVVLIAGDEDMVPAVEAAQAYGVRVHVWGVEPPYGVNQAERLVWEADTVDQLDPEFCRPFVEAESGPVAAAAVVAAVAVAPAAGAAAVDGVAGVVGVDGAGPDPRQSEKPLVPTPAEVFAARKLAMPAAAAVSLKPAPAGSGPDRSGPDRSGSERSVPERSGPERSGPERSGPERSGPERSGPERPEMEQIGARIAARWLLTRGRENVADLLPGPVLPTVIDKELLVEAEEEISRSLRPYEEARRALRDGFWAKLHLEFGVPAVPPAVAPVVPAAVVPAVSSSVRPAAPPAVTSSVPAAAAPAAVPAAPATAPAVASAVPPGGAPVAPVAAVAAPVGVPAQDSAAAPA